MKILGIIPARYGSTRFPGKPLADIAGKSMIQRVYEQCQKASALADVIVATDDQRIFDHVLQQGMKAMMTSSQHPSGTDRCQEVALQFPEFNVFINIQGDEPLIDPVQIDTLAKCFADPAVEIASLCKRIESGEDILNENSPKVVLDNSMNALYFSRTAIPFIRNARREDWAGSFNYYKHIGIYGYRGETLGKITALTPSSLEKAEALEQLRWLENGFRIRMAVTTAESHAVDTPEDLAHVISLFKAKDQ